MPIWTQRVRLQWLPELRFFERRTEMLRSIEELGLLTAFRWRDQTVSARLGPFETLDVNTSGATITLTTPHQSPANLQQALKVALEKVDPQQVVLTGILLHCLQPLAADAADAQLATSGIMNPDLEGTAFDWAMLVDGRSPELNAVFQVEYGVLRADEMGARLNREAGKMTAGALGQVVDMTGTPDAALFMDWNWMLGRPVGDGDVSSAVEEIWAQAADHSARFARRLESRLGFAASEEGTAEAQ